MPLNVSLSFAIGASIGLIVVKYTRPSYQLENVTIACCAAGLYIYIFGNIWNLNNLI